MSTLAVSLRPLAEPLLWLLLHLNALWHDWALTLVALLVLLKMVIPFVLLLPLRPLTPVDELMEKFNEERAARKRRSAHLTRAEFQSQEPQLLLAHLTPQIQFKLRWLRRLGGLITLTRWYAGLALAVLLLMPAPELRGARFLWAPDLTARDPFYVLPALVLLLFGLGIFLSQRKQRQQQQDTKVRGLSWLVPLGAAGITAVLPIGLSFYLPLSIFWQAAVTLVVAIPVTLFFKISRLLKQRPE